MVDGLRLMHDVPEEAQSAKFIPRIHNLRTWFSTGSLHSGRSDFVNLGAAVFALPSPTMSRILLLASHDTARRYRWMPLLSEHFLDGSEAWTMERYDQLREQARAHLRMAARTTDLTVKKRLTENAFALAQQAEALERSNHDEGSQRPGRQR